ncbi:FAD-dependent oxidoreductase [Georgenia sp. TF02-10]|uniref:FAD-dependent oxidoreductase n=1 Tax=Georgenia sp. TF02-10 TaxID=2917725 RepID=UPI001FA6F915|nr:FAD-dependent oxidoreductase [Georgenia sp. TF02-10]UNX54726.1 FAD-dependent oxidoreductase [Georgenia sp. TF02-10]
MSDDAVMPTARAARTTATAPTTSTARTPADGGRDRADGGRDPDVVVVGGGMAGLVTAYELTRRGRRVHLLEAAADVGGLVAGAELGGTVVDLGAEAFALRRPAVAALAAELGLAVQQPAAGSWLWAAGYATPVPARSLLGIPADPGAPDVVRALGPAGAARAARDADLGPDVGADAADLATLVAARMGPAVLDRLVAPVAGGIHSADPAALAVDAVAPGLRRALRDRGSLAAAVAALLDAAPPGAPVATVVGGCTACRRPWPPRCAEPAAGSAPARR